MSRVTLPLIVDAGTEPCDPSVRGSGPNVASRASLTLLRLPGCTAVCGETSPTLLSRRAQTGMSELQSAVRGDAHPPLRKDAHCQAGGRMSS
jgi:hypothetical protein